MLPAGSAIFDKFFILSYKGLVERGSIDLGALAESGKALLVSWRRLGGDVTLEDELLLGMYGALGIDAGREVSEDVIEALGRAIPVWKKRVSEAINTVEVRAAVSRISLASLCDRARSNSELSFNEVSTMAGDVRSATAQYLTVVWGRAARITERLQAIGEKH